MPCDEYLELAGMLAIAGSSAYFQGTLNREMGLQGEKVADYITSNVLGLQSTGFEPKQSGFDQVYRDPSGKIVIAEFKTTGTMKSPGSLLQSTASGQQLSKAWVMERAQLMTDPKSSLYSESNKAIGQAILNAGYEGIRTMVVEVDAKNQAAGAYERSESGWSLTESVS